MPWVDSILRVQSGIPYLACHREKEHTEKKFTIYCGSACRNYPYWLSTTEPGASPLDHICRNLHQRCRVWREWWLQPVDPITIGSLRHPAYPCPCHYPDRYPSLIWDGPDGLGFRRVLMVRWRHVGQDKRVCNVICCDFILPGLLLCS